MQNEITKLVINARRPGLVDVHLDGEFRLNLAKPIAATLSLGQFLSLEEIDSLKARNLEEKAYQQALGLLSRRSRSEAEIRQRFNRRRISEEVQEKVIDRLRDANYLDDLAFARSWVENRNEFRPRSAWAIRTELRKKGVSGTMIDEALDEFDDEAAVFQAAAIGARKYRNLDEDLFRKRLGAYLARRGFQYHLIKPAVEHEWSELAGMKEESEG
jgi:regulatory protein